MTIANDPRHHSHATDRKPAIHVDRPRATPAAAACRPQPLQPTPDAIDLIRGDRLALTVTEAASLLGISRALAYELVARGELPSIRLGRRLVVPKVAVLELLGLHRRSDP